MKPNKGPRDAPTNKLYNPRKKLNNENKVWKIVAFFSNRILIIATIANKAPHILIWIGLMNTPSVPILLSEFNSVLPARSSKYELAPFEKIYQTNNKFAINKTKYKFLYISKGDKLL